MVITDVNQVVYQGNGSNTAFPFTFRIIDATDVKLLLIDVDGTETDITSDYFVDTVNSTVHYPGYAPGAEPGLADQPAPVQTGQRLVVYRELPVTQEKDLGEKWPFNVIELGLDKLTMILQQISGWWDRCLKISPAAEAKHPDFDMTFPIEAGKSFRVNAEGTGFEVSDDPGIAAEAAYEALEKAEAAQKAAESAMEAAEAAAAQTELQAIWFDNVADMQAANLVDGITAGTKGYHTVNDGGSAVYTIRSMTQSDVEDGASIIFLDNGNVAEKLNYLTASQFPGDNDAEILQNAIDFAVEHRYSTLIIDKKFDITGQSLYIDKGIENWDDDGMRQRLTFTGMGIGEIYKGDGGFIFTGHLKTGHIFAAGDVTATNLRFRGSDEVVAAEDRTSLCSVWDCSKIIRINSINNSYDSVGVAFDGTYANSASNNMQQIYTYGDMCTDSYCYLLLGEAWVININSATIEKCVYGAINRVDASTPCYMTDIHFRDCTIEGNSSGGIVLEEQPGTNNVSLLDLIIDGCYFEANGSKNIVINITFSRGIKIINNKLAVSGNAVDLWLPANDTVSNLDGNITLSQNLDYMFYVSNNPPDNVKVFVKGEMRAYSRPLCNKPNIAIERPPSYSFSYPKDLKSGDTVTVPFTMPVECNVIARPVYNTSGNVASFFPATALTAGAKTFTFYAIDKNGNISASTNYRMTFYVVPITPVVPSDWPPA